MESYHASGGRGGALGATKAASSPMDQARLVERVSALSKRITSLAERLVGSWPEGDRPTVPTTFGGLIGGIEVGVNAIDNAAALAEDALDRIEKALP